jgi:GNAT superfamily N-acetyltransferase
MSGTGVPLKTQMPRARRRSPYCGGKAGPPDGRPLAASAAQCKGQVRAFGRRLIDAPEAAAARLSAAGGHGCGVRGAAALDDCRAQVRLYGVLPAVDALGDLHRRTFVAGAADEYDALPRVRVAHAFATNVLAGRSEHSRGGELVFVSVGVPRDDGDAPWAARPTEIAGGVGFAFGYFRPERGGGRRHGGGSVFHIVHVYVNPPYRKGGVRRASQVSSWVLRKLVSAVVARARHHHGPGTPVELTIDPNAPCFQLGNPQYLTAARSDALERVYADAGFERVPLPHEGRSRRTMRLRAEA